MKSWIGKVSLVNGSTELILVSWGARVCININGERTDFFRTFRGLRQGDPLSPLLFNLVSDALAAMFDSAKREGVLSGLVPNIFPGGITHL